MNNHRYILEKYKGMNTRFVCPSCAIVRGESQSSSSSFGALGHAATRPRFARSARTLRGCEAARLRGCEATRLDLEPMFVDYYSYPGGALPSVSAASSTWCCDVSAL